MAVNYKKITTVNEITQLSAGATVFVNDSGALKQAKLALITGGATTGGADASALHFKGVLVSLPTDTTSYSNGDVVIVGDKEYVLYASAWYELGDAAGIASNKQAIEDLSDQVDEVQEILNPAGGTSLLSRVEALETANASYIKKISLNGVDQPIVAGAVDLTITGGSSLQGSDEVTITDDVLGIGEVDILKIVQSAGTELVFDAGASA